MGKRKLPKSSPRTAGDPRMPIDERGRQLVSWADRIYFRETYRLAPRLVVFRSGRIEEIRALPYLEGLGQEGLVQGAAILARGAQPEDLVAMFVQSFLSGVTPLGGRDAGKSPEHAAVLVARSGDGARFTWVWQWKPVTKGQNQIANWGAGPDGDRDLPDFTSDVWIDPVVEDALARKGFPGALRSTPASAIFAAANAPPPVDHAAKPAATQSAASEAAGQPRVGKGRAIQFPWDAVAPFQHEVCAGVILFPVGAMPFAMARAAVPAMFETRSLDELIAHGWTNEKQAIHVARKLLTERDVRASLEKLLASRLPLRAKLYACALVAFQQHGRDSAVQEYAARELVDAVDADVRDAGGLRPWIDRQWPERVGPDEEVGLVSIGAAANAAFWRSAFAMRHLEVPVAPDSAVAKALEDVRSLRDALLDRAGIPPGPPGGRLVKLSATVFNVGSPLGERRLERWRETILARIDEPPATLMRDFAAFHGVCLHTVLVLTELIVKRAVAIDTGNLDDWLPEQTDLAGLVEHGAREVARAAVTKAAIVQERLDDALAPEVVELLEKARQIAPWDALPLGCLNETRFRRGDRSADLLEELVSEHRMQPSLAAASEALAVAEILGQRKLLRVHLDRVRALAQGTPHAWLAELRSTLGRPAEFARMDRIDELLTSAPSAPPESSDPREVYALYGADPAKTVAETIRALRAQRDALEWAALVEAVGEDAIEPSPTFPPAPREPIEGAVEAAIAAARARIDAPNAERAVALGATRKRAAGELEAMERHLARAGALVGADPALAAEWLSAIGDEGVVGALDAALAAFRGAPTKDITPEPAIERVTTARALADEALASAIAATWLAALSARLTSIWPLIAQSGPTGLPLARRTAEVQRAAAEASNESARAAVDRAVTALLTEAGNLLAGDEPQDDAKDAVGSPTDLEELAFRPMKVGADALERSRRDLATAEWALHEGLRQIAFFNLARGRRDLKMLQGTRGETTGALWELRHRDARHPVRVLYRSTEAGPLVIAILAKQDDAHQRRTIAKVRSWAM